VRANGIPLLNMSSAPAIENVEVNDITFVVDGAHDYPDTAMVNILGTSHNIQFEHTTFQAFDVGSSPTDVFHLGFPFQRVHIVDCTLQTNSQSHAVVVQGPRNEDLTIEGCHFTAEETDGAQSVGLELKDGSGLTGLFVRHNHFAGMQQAILTQDVSHLDNAHFEANTIESHVSGLRFLSLPAVSSVVLIENNINLQPPIDNQPVRGGVVVEKMSADARLMLNGNQIKTRECGAFKVLDIGSTGQIQVNANVFRAEFMPVIEIRTGAPGNEDDEPSTHILFSNNQVYTEKEPDEIRCTVELNASRVVVMGNYIADQPRNGNPSGTSICLVNPKAAAAIGNLTRNGVQGDLGQVSPAVIVNNPIF
jgi:hypothetical protein